MSSSPLVLWSPGPLVLWSPCIVHAAGSLFCLGDVACCLADGVGSVTIDHFVVPPQHVGHVLGILPNAVAQRRLALLVLHWFLRYNHD